MRILTQTNVFVARRRRRLSQKDCIASLAAGGFAECSRPDGTREFTMRALRKSAASACEIKRFRVPKKTTP